MKIFTTKTVLLTDNIGEYIPLSESSYEYVGPIAKADRAAQSEASQNVKTANTTAGQFQNNAGQDRGLLTAAYKNDINNPTGFDANTQHQLLTSGEAGAGGATSSIAGQVGLEANRTHNTGSSSALLDSLARAKAQAGARTSEGVAADSAKLAQAKRSQALSGVHNMYNTDVSGNLKAMGIGNEAINTQINAGKTGWFQNATDLMRAAGDDAKGAAALGA
jgi:hypothetical protein